MGVNGGMGMKLEVVLTGLNTGKTAVICGKHFVNGKLVLEGSNQEQIGFQRRYVERTCEAFAAGSVELAEAQERDRGRGIFNNTAQASANQHSAAVSSGVDGSAGKLQKVHGVAGSESNLADAADGQTGLVSGGSGHADSGLHPEQIADIRKALKGLDPMTDSNWTEEGLPSVEAVSAVMADPTITRAMIVVVEPGLNREKAFDEMPL